MVVLITDTFLPVKLLGGSLVFQFMAGSLLLKDCISTFQDNMLFFIKTMMILTMFYPSQAFSIQSSFLG